MAVHTITQLISCLLSHMHSQYRTQKSVQPSPKFYNRECFRNASITNKMHTNKREIFQHLHARVGTVATTPFQHAGAALGNIIHFV